MIEKVLECFCSWGDNRADSYDSRMADMGTVDRAAMLGRARLILWPPGRFGAVE